MIKREKKRNKGGKCSDYNSSSLMEMVGLPFCIRIFSHSSSKISQVILSGVSREQRGGFDDNADNYTQVGPSLLLNFSFCACVIFSYGLFLRRRIFIFFFALWRCVKCVCVWSSVKKESRKGTKERNNELDVEVDFSWMVVPCSCNCLLMSLDDFFLLYYFHCS